MQTTFIIIDAVVGVLLALAILLQEKGSGMGEALGGAGNAGGFQTTKRGAELVLSNVTVLLLVVFLGLSLALNFI